MKKLLKYEGKFEIGQTIKAFDFEPMAGRPDRFVQGEITGIHEGNYKAFIVDGETLVPMEISGSDYDGRIELVETKKPVTNKELIKQELELIRRYTKMALNTKDSKHRKDCLEIVRVSECHLNMLLKEEGVL